MSRCATDLIRDHDMKSDSIEDSNKRDDARSSHKNNKNQSRAKTSTRSSKDNQNRTSTESTPTNVGSTGSNSTASTTTRTKRTTTSQQQRRQHVLGQLAHGYLDTLRVSLAPQNQELSFSVAQQQAWVHFVQQFQEPQEEDAAAAVRDTVQHKLVQRLVAWFCPSNDNDNTVRLNSSMIHTLVHAQNNQGETALQVAPPSLKQAMEKAITVASAGTTITNDEVMGDIPRIQQQEQHEGETSDKDTDKDSQRQE